MSEEVEGERLAKFTIAMLEEFGLRPVAQSDYKQLVAERDRYKSALEEIAALDYRGNEPREQSIARVALNREKA